MLVVIKVEDFRKIMENYPGIPISICKIFVQYTSKAFYVNDEEISNI
jgi:hypothetical protein